MIRATGLSSGTGVGVLDLEGTSSIDLLIDLVSSSPLGSVEEGREIGSPRDFESGFSRSRSAPLDPRERLTESEAPGVSERGGGVSDFKGIRGSFLIWKLGKSAVCSKLYYVVKAKAFNFCFLVRFYKKRKGNRTCGRGGW
jgi:hypothetical protein